MSHNDERKIICVDMDEVIADALSEHLSRYNRDFPEQLTVDDLHGRWLWDAVPPARVAALERYMLSDDFFAVLDVMPESQRVLERLQSRYDVFIATAAMEVPTSFNAKFQWLARHFPFIPTSRIVFCGDKGILRGDLPNRRQSAATAVVSRRRNSVLVSSECECHRISPRSQLAGC
jgi:5'(3')-deoxyribonucleotidase